ncbi:GumC family protein [Salinispira pacifica]|uniref:Tyrosine-protein kinase Wzc n=1 Tax=Salinispira pacifica TaxID=1307761 RepID=V5WKZ5_9SPIO|nr:GNVR domain-containing protein [Salinispira pacifica]AHC16497.1 hypothetical protein L21SP2_3157 [Salinispira pacifica]
MSMTTVQERQSNDIWYTREGGSPMNNDSRVAAGSQSADEISLVDLLSVLIRNRKLIILLPAIIGVLTLIVLLISAKLPPEASFLPNSYEASAIVMIEEERSSSGISAALASSGLGNLAGLAGIQGSGGRNYGSLAVEITNMNSYLDSLALRHNLAAEFSESDHPRHAARSFIRSGLNTQFDSSTGFLSVSFSHTDPVFSAELVNSAVAELKLYFQEMGIDQNREQQTLLEQKIAEVQGELEDLENRIQEFQRNYGVLSAETLVTEQLSTIGRIRSELILKDMEIRTYRDMVSVEDPQLQQLQAERNNLSALLDEMEGGYSEFESVLPSQQDIPEIAMEYQKLKREMVVQEEIYTRLVTQYESSKLFNSSEEDIFKIMEYAETPISPTGPDRKILLIVATLAAGFMAVFIAFILEYIRKIREDDTEQSKLKEAWNQGK